MTVKQNEKAIKGLSNDVLKLKTEANQAKCNHSERLLVDINTDGYIWSVTCEVCGKEKIHECGFHYREQVKKLFSQLRYKKDPEAGKIVIIKGQPKRSLLKRICNLSWGI